MRTQLKTLAPSLIYAVQNAKLALIIFLETTKIKTMENLQKYKNKETEQIVEVRKLSRKLTYPKVFFEVRTLKTVEYVALKDFKKQYELIKI